jgi:hypothetical protein
MRALVTARERAERYLTDDEARAIVCEALGVADG